MAESLPIGTSVPRLVQACHYRAVRRDDICLYRNLDGRTQLQALVIDRNTPRKLVWRAVIMKSTIGQLLPTPKTECLQPTCNLLMG